MRRAVAAVLLLALPEGAIAAERGYTVTDFDRIRVVGPFVVEMVTGKSPSVRAIGPNSESIEQVSVSVIGQMLVIKVDHNAWRGWSNKPVEAARIRVTGHMVRAASVEGSGALTVNAIKGMQVQLGVAGSGSLSVGKVDADRLNMSVQGSGSLNLSGVAKTASAYGRGSGSLVGDALRTKELQVTWQSSGNLAAQATSTAKILSSGAGNVLITGSATCTVNGIGSGTVRCGDKTN